MPRIELKILDGAPAVLLAIAASVAVGSFAQHAAAQSAAALRQGFLNPPDDAKPMMRWWWFGPAVVKPELEKELEQMHSAGIGGVEIQPVYPLMLDDPVKDIANLRYMSPEFLGDVSFANQKARALGMRVSITLGSGWPYGGPTTALANAAARLRIAYGWAKDGAIVAPELDADEAFIAAFLGKMPQEGESFSADHPFDPYGPPQHAVDSQVALYIVSSHTRQLVKRAAFGAEGYVLDHFSRAAIEEHLNDVATPLLAAFGNQPPSSVFSDSLEVYGADWTPDFIAEFKKRRGYDIVPHLPELFGGNTIEASSVRHDWGETLHELIRENYLEPLAQFATAHNTFFRSQTYGDPAVTLDDEATAQLIEGEGPQWREFSYARWATSAGHLYGRNVISAETWTWLHSPAFRATPLDMKAEADRMFLIGVNQLVGHGWPYSPPAAGEPGWTFYAAAAFNTHNPWFPVMPDVMNYMTRVSWLLRQGKPANDVAILLPEDDAQAAFTRGHVAVTDEMKKRISPMLMGAMLDAGYNVDFIDAATIEKLDAIPYPVLVIPPTRWIPLAVYKKIADFASRGGKVISIDLSPWFGPGLMEQKDNPDIRAISTSLFAAGGDGIYTMSYAGLGDVLHEALKPDVDFADSPGAVGFIHRKLPDADIYFVANTGNHPVATTIQFRATRPHVEAWNPDSEDVTDMASSTKSIALELAPYESRVFVLTGEAPSPERPASTNSTRRSQATDLSNGWQIQFHDSPSAAAATLGSWTDLAGRQFYSGEASYTRSFALRVNHGIRAVLDFGDPTPSVEPVAPAADVRTVFSFDGTRSFAGTDTNVSYGMHALLDPPIREAAVVYVNGQLAGSLWHPPYRIDIGRLLHAGHNQIQVRVYNTAINELAGQPRHDYRPLYAKYGTRFEPQDMDNLKPVPSGMMGPLRLIVASP